MGLTTGLDIGLLFCLIAIFFYVFIKSVITAQYKVYLLFHFFMMIWPLGQVGVHMTAHPHLQTIFITLSFVGLSMLGFGWLLFSKYLVYGPYYKPGKNVVVAILVPSILLSIAMIWNPRSIFVAPVGGSYNERVYGPIFWLMIILLLSYYVYSLVMISRAYKSAANGVDRQRTVNALIGVSLIAAFPLVDLILNVVLGSWLPIIPGITSLGIVVTDIHFVIALKKHRSFDLVSIAKQDVVDTLSVGIVVLDEYDMVIEMNRNVSPRLGIRIGRKLDLEALLSSHSENGRPDEAFLTQFRALEQARIATDILVRDECGKKQYLSLHASSIRDGAQLAGKVITFHDITELKSLIVKSQEHNVSLQERNRALIHMQDELFQANRKLEQMAITDSLTGCFNRRFLMQQLEHEVLTNVRYKIPFALLLFDIDLFKLVNDTYGHVAGDEVIRRTAEAVRGALRRTDVLARYGGEEFAVYLPHTTKEQADMLAQRIREVVESNEIPTGRGRSTISVTISVGMHVVEEQFDLQADNLKNYLKDLFTRADSALYRAKDNGRNRVVNH